jgi:cytidylate kinase
LSVPVITVDGPGGSGKGTVCRALATTLGWHYLDSGALYRIVGLAAAERGIALEDVASLASLAATLPVRFGADRKDERVWLGNRDVSVAARTEDAGKAASSIAVLPEVRAALLGRQRAFAAPPGLVAEGRDMGTVVFPDADLKVYLTASPEERARRRHKQLKEKGIDVSLPALLQDIAARDERDANRPVAPLRAADDARELDSTDMSAQQVVSRILDWWEATVISRRH